MPRPPRTAAVLRRTVSILTVSAVARVAGGQEAPDPRVAAACRRPLTSAEEVTRAIAEVEPMLPRRAWARITLAAMPASVSPDVRASVLPPAPADVEGGPVLYWRPPIDGAVVVHELTHALQGALERTAHDGLLADLAAHDVSTGFPAEVVAAATASVIGGIAVAMSPSRAGRATRALRDAVGAEPATGRGALARRGALLARVLATPALRDAREALARRGVAGGEWRAELRALLLDEAHAHEAAWRCRSGLASALWSPRARTPLLADVVTAAAPPRADPHAGPRGTGAAPR